MTGIQFVTDDKGRRTAVLSAVIFNPPEADLPDGQGTFFWDGAAGTWFWIDPTNDIVFVGMIQRLMIAGGPNLEYLSRSVVYQALVDPEM